MRVLEKRGVPTEHGSHEAEAAVDHAALEQVGAQKPPDWMEAQIPETGALAAVEHILRTPAGVAVHLLDLVREVAVGHVPQGAREPARVSPWLESLVHASLDEAP